MLQRCSEFTELSQSLPLMQQVLPLDASCEDLEVSNNEYSSTTALFGFIWSTCTQKNLQALHFKYFECTVFGSILIFI